MRIRNHKGSIMTFTQKLKTKKKQITKLETQNVSHLEEKIRLKHEIADKLENKNIPAVKLSINESPDIEDHDHSSFTVISHKKKKNNKQNSTVKKCKKKSITSTKHSRTCTPAPQATEVKGITSRRPESPAVIQVSTEPKVKKTATMGKTTIISSSLGAGIGNRFKNWIRKTSAYVKRGASIDRIHKDLDLNAGYRDSDKLFFQCWTNDLANNTLGQTVIKYDNLLDKTMALNRKAQIYAAGLPLRWDKPEINDSILNLNAYLEHKSKKLGRINYNNYNIFTRCRKTR